MFELIFSLAFAFFALIAMLFGMLKGRKYNWLFSISRIIIVIVSTVISMFLSALAAWLVGGLLFDLIHGLLAEAGEIGKLLDALPSAPDAIRAIISMILAPIMFFLIFVIVRAILNCFSGLICKLLMKIGKKDEEAPIVEESTSIQIEQKPKKNQAYRSNKKFDPIGAVCGAVCGFLVYIVMLIPFIGTLTSVNNTVQIAAVVDEPVVEMVTEISDAAAENIGAKTVRALGGKPIYSFLTSYSVNGERTSLAKETEFLGELGGALASAVNGESDNKQTADALRAASKSFEKSTMVPMLLSDFLSAASDSWSAGEAFCGIACPNVGEDFDDIFNTFIVIMKDSSYDTICGDIDTVINIVAIVVENDALNTIKEENGTMKLLKNEVMISSLMLEILKNERLSPMTESFTNLGISMFTESIEIYSDENKMYDDFIAQMSDEYVASRSEETLMARLDRLSKAVADTYDDFGIKISDGVSTCIAANMINGLGSGTEMDVKSFFASSNAPADSLNSGNKLSVEYLSTAKNSANAIDIIAKISASTNKDTTLDELKAVIKAEFSIVLSGISDQKVDEFVEKLAKDMHDDIVDGSLKYDGAVFNDGAELGKKSVRITENELKVTNIVISDKEQEANALAKVFSSAIGLIDDISGENVEIQTVMVSFGPVLDSFASCQTIGSERTAKLLTAILQSDKIRSNIGFSLLQATEIADSINDGVAKDDSYAVLLKSLGDTVEIIKLSSENADTTEAVTALMKDLTPSSAEVLQQLATPETVKNYGVSEESAKPISDMFSNMFGNMADAKESGMSDEQYEKEAAAVNDMMNIAMTASNSSNKATFGEDSSTGITASEFVDRVTDSQVMSETLINTVYGENGEEAKQDPLDTGKELSEAEKTELVSALDTKWKEQLATSNDAEANAEYQKVLNSVASILNVNVAFSGDSVTIA